jgi:hypothetical protein
VAVTVAYCAYCAVAATVGLAVAVVVAVGLAVAVAVAVAVMAPSPCCSAKAADADTKINTAVAATRSIILFMRYPFYESACHKGHTWLSFFPLSDIMGVCAFCVKRISENPEPANFRENPFF